MFDSKTIDNINDGETVVVFDDYDRFNTSYYNLVNEMMEYSISNDISASFKYMNDLDSYKLDKVLEDMITKPEKETVEQRQKDKIVYGNMKSRVQTLMEVKNDLKSRLEELI